MLPVDATLADLLKEPERKPRLLVVDDQPTNIQVLYRVFADDCQVFMATSGEQALHTAREEAPDVILLDVMMPDMDGYEVCRQLKQDSATRDIPILLSPPTTKPRKRPAAWPAGRLTSSPSPSTRRWCGRGCTPI